MVIFLAKPRMHEKIKNKCLLEIEPSRTISKRKKISSKQRKIVYLPPLMNTVDMWFVRDIQIKVTVP